MHSGQGLVYLLNNLASWVAFSVMWWGRLTVCRHWSGVRSLGVFFTISTSLACLPLRLSSSPHRQNAQMPFVYSSVGLHTHMQMLAFQPTHTRTLSLLLSPQPIFIQMNWLFHTCMISPRPHHTPSRIQFPCWWNLVYSINASKHTAAQGVHYDTADEWLRRLCHAIIIVIMAIIWPSFGHLAARTCNHRTWQSLSMKLAEMSRGAGANWFGGGRGETPASLLSKFMHCIYPGPITLTRHIYHIINPEDYHQKSINQ